MSTLLDQMTPIAQRIRVVVNTTTETGVQAYLARESEFSRSTWGNVLSGRQRPTSEMIEWVCKKWPEYAFWIATGRIPTAAQKHLCPTTEGKELSRKVILTKRPANWADDEVQYFLNRTTSPALRELISDCRQNKTTIADQLAYVKESLGYYRTSGVVDQTLVAYLFGGDDGGAEPQVELWAAHTEKLIEDAEAELKAIECHPSP